MNRDPIVQQENNLAAKLDKIWLEGLDCGDCAAKLEKRIGLIPGVDRVAVSFGTSSLEVSHTGPLQDILAVISNLGYVGHLNGPPAPAEPGQFWRTNQYARSATIAGGILGTAFILHLTGAPPLLTDIVYLLCILAGGFLPARAGLAMLREAYELDMNVLMAVAVLGAVALGELQEGAVVVFLFAFGNALQANAMDKTRHSIRALMNLSPDKALVRRMGLEMLLPVTMIRLGDTVIVRPGERIPMDGTVTAGNSSVDQAAITGESIPVIKAPGDEVFAGTINGRGALEIQVAHLAQYNKIGRIIHLVEEAQAQRAPSQQLVDRFARHYTPIVLGLAVLIALVPPLFLAQPWHLWLYQAMALLLVACPCALVISAPVSIVSAIGGAARRGVLIKGGVHLEQAGSLAVIAFDKTGTLTRGRPEVTDIIDWSGNEERLLAVAAAIESRSEHPLADAVLQSARQRGLPVPAVTDFEALVGQGARGNIDGELYLVGNMRIFAGYDLPPDLEIRLHELQNQGKSIILVGNQKKLLGLLAVADIVRSNSPAALESLRRHGIRKLVMLTGDNPATAGAIARQTGVDEFSADLMPEDKVQAVRELLARHGKVAMVGDGVNDAPAMAIATVGIAMGTAGTDAALETADIALMGDDLSRLAYTIHLGRQTVRVLKQNIAFAVVVKVIIMLMALPGWLTLWLAVLGDMGTSLLVTLNGMRLMWMRDQAPLK